MHVGDLIVTALSWYLRLGVGVALVFAVFVQRVVPSAQGGSLAFRLLIVPGATLLWPLVLVRSVAALRSPAKEHG